MLCEKCQQRQATVHITGTRKVAPLSSGPNIDETIEHHFCELCVSTSPLVNPVLEYGPNAISEKFRVISVSAERTRVRLVRTESEARPEEWSFVTSRLPPPYAVVGAEFEITCSPEELDYLRGNR